MNENIVNLFYIKRAKPNKHGQVPIFQRITIDGQRIGVNRQQKVY